jgi:hypothetical protein
MKSELRTRTVPGSLAHDFSVFTDPLFLVATGATLILIGAAGGIMLYAAG